ncbi:MAG TPA: TetR family transcriptional regulator [Sphingomonadales bacterium]|nr:TetR family transcriptional regulator [Sphingomonadales bacterium]
MTMTRKKMPAEMRRSVTIEAVLDIAARQNPRDITTAAIAQHMNVTQGALFRHFDNKESLWQAVMEWIEVNLFKRVDQAANEAPTPMAALQAVYMAHIDFVRTHPGVPRIMFGELQRSENTKAKRQAGGLLKKYGARVTTLIDAAREKGEIDPAVDTASARILFIGSIQALVIQSLLVAKDIENISEKAAGVYDIYRRGIEVKR